MTQQEPGSSPVDPAAADTAGPDSGGADVPHRPDHGPETGTDAGQAATVDPGTVPHHEAAPEPAPEPDGATPEAPAPAAQGPDAPAPDAATTSTPAPRPVPRPVPRPTPRTLAARPVADHARPAPVAPVESPAVHDPAAEAEAATWGRVDEEGRVWVRESAGERQVGQFPDAETDRALSLYVRRFLDLRAKVLLFEARLERADLAVKEIDSTLAKLAKELEEPAAVGDLDGLRAKFAEVRSAAAARRSALDSERAAARAEAVAARTAIVERAEKIAAQDPEKTQWRPAGEALRALLEEWKEAQRRGPRIDRPTEDALWKRFSHARTTFDRERRHFFARLEERNAQARATKERLVARAEELSTSTDWGATSAAYRDLMTQWKAAGRAARKDDDALWARFRAAQDVFFAARAQAQASTDADYEANLEVKLQLLEEAEALLPVEDVAAARAALRDIQEKWEQAGKVPRAQVQRVEGRLRAVEQAVRDADQEQWRRSNPETRARAEGAAAQLEQAIAGLERELAEAQKSGDTRKIAEAEAALSARRTWLEQVLRAAAES